ncbi:MAG: S8 family serine peptidase [Undibacterium sp.]|nr:S8 family serine peptidase [Undibacterium sp.]
MTTHFQPPVIKPRSTKRLALHGFCFIALGLTQLSASSAIAAQTGSGNLAPLVSKSAQLAIPDQYILVFKEGSDANVIKAGQAQAQSLGARIGFTYTRSLQGFSVIAPASSVERLRAIAGVAYIEQDSKMSIDVVQTSPPTGLDRTSERLLALDNRYTYSETGTGVHAYVIDTGIRSTHTQFGGRATGGFTSIVDAWGTNDCHGHGTHVAGTVGGTTYGIAKLVNLHPVRVLDCSGSGTTSGVIAGVDWVTNNAVHPAVANMSLGGGLSPALDTSVTNSIASGVTYAIAAGNSNADACTFSPAHVPTAITVGNINPTNDTRSGTSNWGTCLDLFAPGSFILSAGNASDTATATMSGTSMASPHVAGVAALYLQNHVAANPATVWAAIHNAADVTGTAGWAGIINPGVGSPNELLHWGSLNDGHDDGDPHFSTVDGISYDFQSAGEFTTLRDGNGMQVQTRQTPIATTFNPGPNPYTGLASCVSLNTAVAAKLGTHRISYQPNITGIPDPSGMQLRVDGVLTSLGASPLYLGGGGRLAKTGAPGGVEANFPDGSTLIVTPGWWASQSKWYLNVSVYHTRASEGIMGSIAAGSWLPALPNGSNLGPKPANLHQRYLDLNNSFANAWRVTPATSLFDYAAGTSTADFTIPSWPLENPPCIIPRSNVKPVDPLDQATAIKACSAITDKNRNANCVFDVVATGEVGFAKTHLQSQLIEAGSTRVDLDDAKVQTAIGEPANFTATVQRNSGNARRVIPTGMVVFSVDGKEQSTAIVLDTNGQAVWSTRELPAGEHKVGVRFIPAQGSVFMPNSSDDILHLVR